MTSKKFEDTPAEKREPAVKTDTAEADAPSASEQKALNATALADAQAKDWDAQTELYRGSGEAFETPKPDKG